MKNEYKIIVDIVNNEVSEPTEYMEGSHTSTDQERKVHTRVRMTVSSKTLSDAFSDAVDIIAPEDSELSVVGCLHDIEPEHSLQSIQNGFIPIGYTHVSEGNPYVSGNYWCLCRVGGVKPKLAFNKVYFRSEHNSRWLEPSDRNVLAWTK